MEQIEQVANFLMENEIPYMKTARNIFRLNNVQGMLIIEVFSESNKVKIIFNDTNNYITKSFPINELNNFKGTDLFNKIQIDKAQG